MAKFKPWAGEAEWRERQEVNESAARAKYLRFLYENPDATCIGCIKLMTKNDKGKVAGEDRVRCLNCQIKNR